MSTTRRYEPIDLSAVRTVPLGSRPNKVRADDFARPGAPRSSFRQFLARLPRILAAGDFHDTVLAVAAAVRRGRPVVLGMGAHVIKCGLSPIVVDLMERGVISAVAMNGAGAIHDFEVALIGQTSEDVGAGLTDGTFGMAEETGRLINEALAGCAEDGSPNGPGMGRLLGEALLARRPPYVDLSLLAAGARLDLPVTVHVAIGTDIVHMHPAADGRALGNATFRDFRLLAAVVVDLGDGGVYLNVGSAVVLPEVFLKALTVARNLGHPVHDFTTVNLDMQQSYRALQNVVGRPTIGSGRGFCLTGHHELMIPLLAQAILEELADDAGR
ncbi:MAG: hypothetical protein HY331_03455 [Chloroflexi bacterium]|nr:hypothetical protein [Chloroflexota bacterium]